MRIGELGDRCGVTAKTIRYYESIGLLDPPERTTGGYRDYDAAAADRLTFIRDAQATGLRLDEIASVLELKRSGARSCSHTRALVERHLHDIDEQIAALRSARASLAELLERSRELDPSTCTDPNRCQIIDAR